jgi:hypothetical protein
MTAAGWYPDHTSPGSERYWDGTQWTEHSRPAVAQPVAPQGWGPTAPAAPGAFTNAASADKKNWFLRHKILTGIAAFILIAVIASAAGGGGTKNGDNAANKDTAATSAPASSEAPAPVATKAPEKTAETSGQRNAKRSAQNYLSFAAFSRGGLIQQLSSSAGDGYSVADATYAVDALTVDWKEQAYKAAKNYLSISSFSRAGLIQQLESSAGDKYTHAQAVYGADKALAE